MRNSMQSWVPTRSSSSADLALGVETGVDFGSNATNAAMLPRTVEGSGGYSYEQYPDGTLVIRSGPGVNRPVRLVQGAAWQAITDEIGVFPSVSDAVAASHRGSCEYEVQKSDTLWDVARWQLGDPRRWKQLYANNQDIVGEDPDFILPGQVLDICEDTLETGEGDDMIAEAVEEQEPQTFVDVATGMFPTLAGEDGYLSPDDIDAAMTNPDLTLEQSAALVTLRRLQSDLEELNNDEWFDENSGVTMADLERYRETGVLPDSKFTPDQWYDYSHERMQGFSQDLFANGVPDVNAIRQGSLGDCYFLAALGSAVIQDADAVGEMVVREDDGTYTVTFPNGQSANVSAPTLAEMATYGNSGADGMWVTLFERAAGKLRDEDEVLSEEEMDGGSIAGRAGTDLFSGDGSSNVDILGLTANDTTRDRMESAFSEGRVVIAGINNDPLSDHREGLPDAHSYSVIGYDRETDTVMLRNPHGQSEHVGEDGQPLDGKDDGVFTLTMAEFNRLFSHVSYSGGPMAQGE